MQLSRLPLAVLVTLGFTTQVVACSGRQVTGSGDDQASGTETSTTACLSDTSTEACLDPIDTETGPCLGAPQPDFGPCLDLPIPDLPHGTDETDTVPCLAGFSEDGEFSAPRTSILERIGAAAILPEDVARRLGLKG